MNLIFKNLLEKALAPAHHGLHGRFIIGFLRNRDT